MKVGKREVLFGATLIALPGEDIWVEFDAGGSSFRFQLEFILDADIAAPVGLSVRDGGGFGVITLKNLRNAIGTTSSAALAVGKSDAGLEVTFIFWHALTGTTNRIDVQFMSEISQ